MKLQMLAETFIHSVLLTFGQCLSASYAGWEKKLAVVYFLVLPLVSSKSHLHMRRLFMISGGV